MSPNKSSRNNTKHIAFYTFYEGFSDKTTNYNTLLYVLPPWIYLSYSVDIILPNLFFTLWNISMNEMKALNTFGLLLYASTKGVFVMATAASPKTIFDSVLRIGYGSSIILWIVHGIFPVSLIEPNRKTKADGHTWGIALDGCVKVPTRPRRYILPTESNSMEHLLFMKACIILFHAEWREWMEGILIIVYYSMDSVHEICFIEIDEKTNLFVC